MWLCCEANLQPNALLGFDRRSPSRCCLTTEPLCCCFTLAAAQLAALAQQLAASYIEAYCKGCYASLGFGAAVSKADLPRDWLSQLLLQPLLRAACK